MVKLWDEHYAPDEHEARIAKPGVAARLRRRAIERAEKEQDSQGEDEQDAGKHGGKQPISDTTWPH